MVSCCFLLIHFLVVEDHKLSKCTSHIINVSLTLECVTILSWPISSFSASFVSLMMFWLRLLSNLMILVSTHHVTNHLTCHNKLRQPMSCNLILKIKMVGKYSSATFSFWSVIIWYLNLSVQAQTSKAVIQN